MLSTPGLSIKYLKKQPYTGSHRGMRFRLYAPKDSAAMKVWIYGEPWCFDAAPEGEKTLREFPFTQEGLEEAVQWLNTSYEDKLEYWKERGKSKMRI